MEIYNEKKKYANKNLNNLMGEDLTIIFEILLSRNMKNNYKLIDKGERGEIYIVLNKENKLLFYYGNKLKIQIETPPLSPNKQYHVTFIRSSIANKNFVYLNGKLVVASDMQYIEELYITNNEIDFMHGNDDYNLSNIKIYNYSMTIKNVKMNYLYDRKDKYEILKFLSNKLDEIMEINVGIYSGYIMDGMTILFVKPQIYAAQKNYPLDPFIKYNMEQSELSVPQISNFMILNNHDMREKFDLNELANNITTWQFGMYQDLYKKNISNISGYWVSGEISPFIAFTGKGLNYVSENGSFVENRGSFQSGNFVSFIPVLITEFLKTKNNNMFISITKTIDYILAISKEYDNGGVPLYFPNNNDYISIKNGCHINFLRTIEYFLNTEKLHDYIEPKTIELLKTTYKKSLNLLLKLQITNSGNVTIWSEFYDKNTLKPVGENILCSLESAQILLYLMDYEKPSSSMKKAIIGGCEWFKNNKILGWGQSYDKKSYDLNAKSELFEQQTLVHKYGYLPFPEKMCLYSKYYDNVTRNPVFIENGDIYNMETFNDMSVKYRNDEYHLGMWGQYLLELYEEWKIMAGKN